MTDGQEINRLKLEVEDLKSQLALDREDAQVIQLQADNEVRKFIKRIADLEIINKSHQKLNGELQERLSEYEDKAAHYRRKAIL